MNFIVTSPIYPQNFQNFSIRLHANGVNVLGIGTEPYDQMPDDLKAAVTEYYRVNNLEDIDEVSRAVAFLFFKHGKIDRIESFEEYWLELDADLREQFNIPGMKPKDLARTKHKSLMKEYFRKAGAKVADGQLVEDSSQAKSAVKDLGGYPLIAKPDVGVGAADTYRLDNDDDLQEFLNNWDHQTPYFFEQFIDNAVLCTYDGLIDQEGNIVFDGSLSYSVPTLNWVEKDKEHCYWIEKEVDPKLREIGQKIVKVFGYRERFFHIEFFRKENGDYYALEYNNRPVGSGGHDSYNYARSIDLYDEYARIVTGKPFIPSTAEPMYCLNFYRSFDAQYLHEDNEIRGKYGNNVKAIEEVPVGDRYLMGDIHYCITAPDKASFEELVQYLGEKK